MVVKHAKHARLRRVTVLGSTGSVGTSTVDLLLRNRDRFQVEALTANRNVELLARQARGLGARLAVVADPSGLEPLRSALAGSGIEVAAGPSAVVEAASRPADLVMAAIIGSAGLPAVIAAVRRGAMVAFANKETLISAGPLVIQEAARHGATLLPVDSEHNAIFQVLQDRRSVETLILTGSGGPFRTWSVDEMARATPAQAIAHPNWTMGAKISVDSATMMNKGLEIIEASLLFDMPSQRIDVLIHPQSIIHSLVAYEDGSVLAQLGSPDMRTPIAHALAWPERMATPTERLDLARIGRLDFQPPDPVRFPALRIAREALETGGSAPAVLNAANEVAVEAFLAHRIGFLDIVRIVEETLRLCPQKTLESLEAVAEADDEARRTARGLL